MKNGTLYFFQIVTVFPSFVVREVLCLLQKSDEFLISNKKGECIMDNNTFETFGRLIGGLIDLIVRLSKNKQQ